MYIQVTRDGPYTVSRNADRSGTARCRAAVCKENRVNRASLLLASSFLEENEGPITTVVRLRSVSSIPVHERVHPFTIRCSLASPSYETVL